MDQNLAVAAAARSQAAAAAAHLKVTAEAERSAVAAHSLAAGQLARNFQLTMARVAAASKPASNHR